MSGAYWFLLDSYHISFLLPTDLLWTHVLSYIIIYELIFGNRCLLILKRWINGEEHRLHLQRTGFQSPAPR